MSTPCKHEFSAFTTPDPDGSKKKLKFNYCGACGGFMAVSVLTPSQRVGVQAAVEQLRAEKRPTRKK